MPTINTPCDQTRNGVPGGLDSNATLNGRNARADPVQDFEAAANALIARKKLGVPSIAIPVSGQDMTFEMYAQRESYSGELIAAVQYSTRYEDDVVRVDVTVDEPGTPVTPVTQSSFRNPGSQQDSPSFANEAEVRHGSWAVQGGGEALIAWRVRVRWSNLDPERNDGFVRVYAIEARVAAVDSLTY